MPLAELRAHLHTLPDHPNWVPYRTSYYKPEWGFCLAQETLDALPDGEYEVRIDSTLADGHLTYAEHVVPGQVPDEVIVSCHTCHPSLANDNLAKHRSGDVPGPRPRAGDAVLHLPVHLRARHHRGDHLAGP